MSLTIPTIHLNGTSRKGLLDPMREAVHKLHEAGTALAQTAPHGRDYYPQSGEAIYAAQKEHQARMAKIRSVVDELEEIAIAIQRED
jgi:hypothetical protein